MDLAALVETLPQRTAAEDDEDARAGPGADAASGGADAANSTAASVASADDTAEGGHGSGGGGGGGGGEGVDVEEAGAADLEAEAGVAPVTAMDVDGGAAPGRRRPREDEDAGWMLPANQKKVKGKAGLAVKGRGGALLKKRQKKDGGRKTPPPSGANGIAGGGADAAEGSGSSVAAVAAATAVAARSGGDGGGGTTDGKDSGKGRGKGKRPAGKMPVAGKGKRPEAAKGPASSGIKGPGAGGAKGPASRGIKGPAGSGGAGYVIDKEEVSVAQAELLSCGSPMVCFFEYEVLGGRGGGSVCVLVLGSVCALRGDSHVCRTYSSTLLLKLPIEHQSGGIQNPVQRLQGHKLVSFTAVNTEGTEGSVYSVVVFFVQLFFVVV